MSAVGCKADQFSNKSYHRIKTTLCWQVVFRSLFVFPLYPSNSLDPTAAANSTESVSPETITSSNGLKDQRNDGSHHVLPSDYKLMACQMSPMDGYEATRQIRKEEHSGVHIPIIALTTHPSGVEATDTLKARMDAHLGEPLRAKERMNAIKNI